MSQPGDPVFFYPDEMQGAQPFGAGKEPGEQGGIDWLMARVGHVTASRFKDVLDMTKAGKEGAKRRKYRMELVVERLTGKPTQHFVTDAMQDGIDREPLARMAYEAATGAIVAETGFIRHPSIEWVGGSPDGLVGEDGGLEIKEPTPGTLIELLLTGDYSDYAAQVQGLMWITGRQWWDLRVGHPDLPGLEFCQRIGRNEGAIADLEVEVGKFLAEVAETLARLKALKGGA